MGDPAAVRPLPPCLPPLWARGGHAQTILGHILPCSAPRVRGERAEIPLDDGDRLVLFHEPGETDTVVHLFHGLGGDSDADYVRRAARALRPHGIIALNHRGCGAGAGLARGPYNSGSAPELAASVAWGRARHPRARHIGIGFSLSGNALLLLMGRAGAPDAAIAVNPPLDLAACSDAISRGWNRIYDLRFVHQCRRDARARGRGIRPWHTLRDVDERYTAGAAGYRDADDYYRTCSAGPRLGAIDRPTVILTAADDPFVPVSSFRDVPPGIHLHVERVGGHMGYLARDGRWLDLALPAYVESLREGGSRGTSS